MGQNLVQARVDAIRRLTRRRAAPPLRRALAKSSPEDVGQAVGHLTWVDTRYLFEQLPMESAGTVLLVVDEDTFQHVVTAMPAPRLLEWLDCMEPDDVADLVARLPEELRAQALQRMEKDERSDLEELLAYPVDTAGGIMSPVAFVLHEDTTCRDAIAALQEAQDVEMVFYLYLLNDAGQLVGVTSLRQLLLNHPSTPLNQTANPDVITVQPSTDQEEVARIASRYDLLAVPVVDDTRKLLGIVTIDDVLDVVREEAAEDLLKMAGVGDEFDPHGSNTFRAARQRLTWLLVTAVGGMALAEVIGRFDATLEESAVLAGFIPVIMALGGGVGLQAATITVRNLATGHVSLNGGSFKLVFREVRVGLVMGLLLSAALALFGWLRYSNPALGISVGVSILSVVLCAAAVGTTVPLLLEKVGVDPAVATGPFVTITIDTIAIVLYLTIATFALGWM